MCRRYVFRSHYHLCVCTPVCPIRHGLDKFGSESTNHSTGRVTLLACCTVVPATNEMLYKPLVHDDTNSKHTLPIHARERAGDRRTQRHGTLETLRYISLFLQQEKQKWTTQKYYYCSRVLLLTWLTVPVSKTYRMLCDHLVSVALFWRARSGVLRTFVVPEAGGIRRQSNRHERRFHRTTIFYFHAGGHSGIL